MCLICCILFAFCVIEQPALAAVLHHIFEKLGKTKNVWTFLFMLCIIELQ